MYYTRVTSYISEYVTTSRYVLKHKIPLFLNATIIWGIIGDYKSYFPFLLKPLILRNKLCSVLIILDFFLQYNFLELFLRIKEQTLNLLIVIEN